MKRLALIVAGMLAVGCSNGNTPPQETGGPAPVAGGTTETTGSGTATASPTPTPTPAPAAPAPTPAHEAVGNPAATIHDTAPSVTPAGAPTPAAAPTPAVAPTPKPVAKDIVPFEIVKDGKTYVFASIDAMSAFNTSGAQLPTVVEKQNYPSAGKTTVIEAADQAEADHIIASYTKLHPPVASEAPATKPAQ